MVRRQTAVAVFAGAVGMLVLDAMTRASLGRSPATSESVQSPPLEVRSPETILREVSASASASVRGARPSSRLGEARDRCDPRRHGDGRSPAARVSRSVGVAYVEREGGESSVEGAPARPRLFAFSAPKEMVGVDYDPVERIACGANECGAATLRCEQLGDCAGAIVNKKRTHATLKRVPTWARDPAAGQVPEGAWHRALCESIHVSAVHNAGSKALFKRWVDHACDHYVRGDVIPAGRAPAVVAAASKRLFDSLGLPTVVDVGVHNGLDSAAYLRHGFGVVGLEANRDLLDVALLNPVVALAARLGRADLRHVAVDHLDAPLRGEARAGDAASWAPRRPNVTFAVNTKHPEMSSSTLDCAAHRDRGTLACESVPVNTTTCAAVVGALCGTCYYLKVDIEGFDQVCLSSLANVAKNHRPLYVSTEDQSALPLLERLGYAGFKLVPHLMWTVDDDEHLPERALGWRPADERNWQTTARDAKWRTPPSITNDFRFGKPARDVGAQQNDLYACRADVCAW